MDPPQQSYVIWFSQRVGSTVLTQTLEDSGIAGRPREWLNADSAAGLLAKLGASDAFALREALWQRATTGNGVMGVKYGMHADLHREVTALFANVAPRDSRAAWEAFFPRCKHVFLTRRDKLRLAVSWWRAIKSEEWHRPSRPEPTVIDTPSGRTRPPPAPPNLADLYDYDAIAHLIIEASVREADIQAQLERWDIVPYTVVYEDLVACYELTVRRLLDFLEVPGRSGATIAAPAFAKMADELSDAWCERFRHDRATAK